MKKCFIINFTLVTKDGLTKREAKELADKIINVRLPKYLEMRMDSWKYSGGDL